MSKNYGKRCLILGVPPTIAFDLCGLLHILRQKIPLILSKGAFFRVLDVLVQNCKYAKLQIYLTLPFHNFFK